MPVLDQWKLQITVDDVFRAQAANPDVIRQRRPGLVASTEKALTLGLSLIHPAVVFENYAVRRFVHERLELIHDASQDGKTFLAGPLVAQHLAKAASVIVMVCTIGKELDESVSSLFKVDPLLAVALDGVGSAAVENLGIQACNYFEAQANEKGLKTSMPLNPGMVGWPVDQGQPQIFTLVDSEEIKVSLTDSCMMSPNKSLSMVLGIGQDLSAAGSSCDYCSLNGVCKYQNHYAK